ncbi:hypothetical protein [Ekhidna sp.]|uniref:hypothetical protein n=1 Tax=Ekhidna sp. TaxID=2608089 RepID=UPI0032974AB7
MKTLQSILFILFIGLSLSALAQPPGGRRPGGSTDQMIEREKQTLYSKVENLTDDQKLLLDGIYKEFAVTLQETMEEMRQSNDRAGIREKMETLRKEKDELIADVLDEDQFKIYQSITQTKRERKSEDDGKGQN